MCQGVRPAQGVWVGLGFGSRPGLAHVVKWLFLHQLSMPSREGILDPCTITLQNKENESEMFLAYPLIL